jgi:signal transduction histidine kinase
VTSSPDTARLRALEKENAELRRRLDSGGGGANGLDRKALREMLHELRQPVQAARLFHGLLARRVTEGEDGDRLHRLGQAIDAMEARIVEIQMAVRGSD